jgi:hypothetical protein
MERIVIVLVMMIGFDFHPASVREGGKGFCIASREDGEIVDGLFISIEEVPR